MFIKYQGTYHHGNKPFDATNAEHQEILKKWQEGAAKFEKSDYNSAIKIWTINDPTKRAVAKKNHLHFLELWNDKCMCPSKEKVINEIKQYITEH